MSSQNYLHQCTKQRASLAAFILHLLTTEKELTHEQVKIGICNHYGRMIDEGHMADDIIDKTVVGGVIEFMEQQKAVEAAKDILGGS